jgi:hypothetical protein
VVSDGLLAGLRRMPTVRTDSTVQAIESELDGQNEKIVKYVVEQYYERKEYHKGMSTVEGAAS